MNEKMSLMHVKKWILVSGIICMVISCNHPPTPRPRGISGLIYHKKNINFLISPDILIRLNIPCMQVL